jgi:TolB protein
MMIGRKIAFLAVNFVALVCFSGCVHSQSIPLDTDGVRRVTPHGREWSNVTGISWSSDGTELALTRTVGDSNLLPEGYVYIIDVEGRDPWILTQTEADGEFMAPAWHPSSDQLAVYSNGWEPRGIWLTDAERNQIPSFLGEGTDCAWAPNGEQIAIANPLFHSYTLYLLDTLTGEQREVFQVSERGSYPDGRGISWSPIGNLVAFSFGMEALDTTSIYVLDLASGQSRLLVEGGQNVSPSWSPDGTMLAFAGGESWHQQTLIIIRMDDGSTMRPLSVEGITSVAWSPDGNKIAFVWKGDVYTIDLEVALRNE